MDSGVGVLYTTVIDFTDNVVAADDTAGDDEEGLANGESIEILGRSYTFDPSNDKDDDLVLFGSDVVDIINKDETKSYTVEGETYDVTVIGGNSDDSTAIIKVGGETKTVESGDTKTIGGLSIYVDDVFIQNIGEETISSQVFIGSDKITIPNTAATTAGTTFKTIEINGEDLDEVKVAAETGVANNWNDLEQLSFQVTPSDADEEVNWLMVGEEYVDPLFGTIKLSFAGPADITSGREMVELKRSGDELEVTFTNREGNEIVINPYVGDGVSDIEIQEDWFAAGDNALTGDLDDLAEDDIFILTEGADITDVFSVESIEDGKVEFYSYANDDKFYVDETEELGSNTGAYVCGTGADAGADVTIMAADNAIDLIDAADCDASGASALVAGEEDIITENEMTITLGTAVGAGTATVTFDETTMEEDEAATAQGTVTATLDSSTDNDMEITTIAGGSAKQGRNRDYQGID